MIKQYIKRITISASAFVFAISLAVLWMPSAHASTTLISCTGTQTANYGPPLGPLPQNTTVHVDERLGTDSNGNGTCTGPFTGGHAEEVFHQQASCLIPPLGGTVVTPNVITYHWNNGEQSTITFTLTTVLRIGGQSVITSTGTVTDGYGEGAAAHREKILADINLLECLASSVEQNSGPMTLTIGGL